MSINLERFLPCLSMVLVQLGYVGSTFLSKVALEKGMSFFVFTAYRHIIAMFALSPFAYYLERKIRPRLTVPILTKIFILALFGTSIQQNLFYAGLTYASPTLAIALNNLVPAATFVLAAVVGFTAFINSLNYLFWWIFDGHLIWQGRAKMLGTLISIAGALIFTLWKGVPLNKLKTPVINIYGEALTNQRKGDWIRGSALVGASFILFSSYLISQAVVFQCYAAPLTITAMTNIFTSVQSLVIAMAFERKHGAWRVEWNIQLFATIYGGIIVSSGVYYLQTFAISKRGPVFASMFQPLLLVTVGLLSVVLFGEQLHMGSVVGFIIIVVGFYSVLWGKSQDSQASGVEDKSEKVGLRDIEGSTLCHLHSNVKNMEPEKNKIPRP